MFVTLIILTLLAAVLLIGVVLIQKSKGGGLSSTFAGSNQIMGVRRTNSFIEKATWWLAGAICVFSVLTTFVMPSAIDRTQSRVEAPAAQQTTGTNYDTQLPAAEAPVATATEAAETPAPAQAE